MGRGSCSLPNLASSSRRMSEPGIQHSCAYLSFTTLAISSQLPADIAIFATADPLGLRQTGVHIDYEGKQDRWGIRDLSVTLRHGDHRETPTCRL